MKKYYDALDVELWSSKEECRRSYENLLKTANYYEFKLLKMAFENISKEGTRSIKNLSLELETCCKQIASSYSVATSRNSNFREMISEEDFIELITNNLNHYIKTGTTLNIKGNGKQFLTSLTKQELREIMIYQINLKEVTNEISDDELVFMYSQFLANSFYKSNKVKKIGTK